MRLLFLITASFFLSVFARCQKIYQNHPITLIDGSIPPDTAYVYILAGQSNLCGRAASSNYTGNYTGQITAGDKAVYIRNYVINPGTYDTLETGVNSSDFATAAGMQPLLGYDLCNYRNKNIYFLQSGQGGKAIIEWHPVGALGRYLDTSIYSLPSFMASIGKQFVFKAMIWYQGESNNGDTSDYKTQFTNLVNRVRDSTGVADLPVIMVQFKDCQTGMTNQVNMQTMQETLAATISNLYLVPKSEGTTCQDVLHVDYTTQVSLANYIYNLIKDW